MTREEIQKYADKLAQEYFPDECNIWARKNLEAEFVSEACMRMAKHIERGLIEKACKYLDNNFPNVDHVGSWCKEGFIKQFKKAMKDWIKIPRNKDGFYNGDVSELFEYVPFILREYTEEYGEWLYFVDIDDFYAYAGDIDTKPKNTHILPCVPRIKEK